MAVRLMTTPDSPVGTPSRVSSPSKLFDEVDLLPGTPPPGMQPWLGSFVAQIGRTRAVNSMNSDVKTPYKQAMKLSLALMHIDSSQEMKNHCSFIARSFAQPLASSLMPRRPVTVVHQQQATMDAACTSTKLQVPSGVQVPDHVSNMQLQQSPSLSDCLMDDLDALPSESNSSRNNMGKNKVKKTASLSHQFKTTKAFEQAHPTMQSSKSHEFKLPLPPLQLPVKIKKKFKGEYIEAIILYSDSVDACRSVGEQGTSEREKQTLKGDNHLQYEHKKKSLKRKRQIADTSSSVAASMKSKFAKTANSRPVTRGADKQRQSTSMNNSLSAEYLANYSVDDKDDGQRRSQQNDANKDRNNMEKNNGNEQEEEIEKEGEQEGEQEREQEDDTEDEVQGENANGPTTGNEDGSNRRASTFVLITKSTKKYKQYEGHICTSLTGALFFCQNNSENGWSYVEESTGVKLHNFRVKNGGLGFMNPKGAHPLYRDYLSLCRLEQAKNNRKFYQPEELVQHMTQKVPIEKVVQYLCRDRPDLLKSLPCATQ
jgi:hypothetical protein